MISLRTALRPLIHDSLLNQYLRKGTSQTELDWYAGLVYDWSLVWQPAKEDLKAQQPWALDGINQVLKRLTALELDRNHLTEQLALIGDRSEYGGLIQCILSEEFSKDALNQVNTELGNRVSKQLDSLYPQPDKMSLETILTNADSDGFVLDLGIEPVLWRSAVTESYLERFWAPGRVQIREVFPAQGAYTVSEAVRGIRLASLARRSVITAAAKAALSNWGLELSHGRVSVTLIPYTILGAGYGDPDLSPGILDAIYSRFGKGIDTGYSKRLVSLDTTARVLESAERIVKAQLSPEGPIEFSRFLNGYSRVILEPKSGEDANPFAARERERIRDSLIPNNRFPVFSQPRIEGDLTAAVTEAARRLEGYAENPELTEGRLMAAVSILVSARRITDQFTEESKPSRFPVRRIPERADYTDIQTLTDEGTVKAAVNRTAERFMKWPNAVIQGDGGEIPGPGFSRDWMLYNKDRALYKALGVPCSDKRRQNSFFLDGIKRNPLLFSLFYALEPKADQEDFNSTLERLTYPNIDVSETARTAFHRVLFDPTWHPIRLEALRILEAAESSPLPGQTAKWRYLNRAFRTLGPNLSSTEATILTGVLIGFGVTGSGEATDCVSQRLEQTLTVYQLSVPGYENRFESDLKRFWKSLNAEAQIRVLRELENRGSELSKAFHEGFLRLDGSEQVSGVNEWLSKERESLNPDQRTAAAAETLRELDRLEPSITKQTQLARLAVRNRVYESLRRSATREFREYQDRLGTVAVLGFRLADSSVLGTPARFEIRGYLSRGAVGGICFGDWDRLARGGLRVTLSVSFL